MHKQQPIGTDDFGNELYRCRYTDKIVSADHAFIVGAVTPGVKARYIAADTDEARQAHKENSIAFHENDANCNTCRHLERVKHEKSAPGFLRGRCKNQEADMSAHPYKDRFQGNVMVFHPDDWMGMPCYSSRWED